MAAVTARPQAAMNLTMLITIEISVRRANWIGSFRRQVDPHFMLA
jgi:hypothetical protein